MHAPNDLQFDPQTHSLFCIYYEAWIHGRSNASATTYLKRYDEAIKTTGQVLEWLYLTEPDRQNRLGWKPTSFLMSLLARPRRRLLRSQKHRASSRDKEAFNGMISTTLGNGRTMPQMRAYVISVLSFLNLIRCAKNGDVVPTRALLEIIASRRWEETVRRHETMMSTGAAA
jgi:hypothetical protein